MEVCIRLDFSPHVSIYCTIFFFGIPCDTEIMLTSPFLFSDIFCISFSYLIDAKTKSKLNDYSSKIIYPLCHDPPPTPKKETHLDTPPPGKWHIPIPLMTLYWWPWLLIYTINLENSQGQNDNPKWNWSWIKLQGDTQVLV